ncbi:hypothetical protein [Gimesia sp.]|uniref:hypothetical protein n=1 Tax=Gimesia sp. TaxID=2024833 RepID=UPI000C56094C|nr:hypothetical protein [Gimesia sp.]MAX36052.1 hypothetical protein [Gimesia sp.]HAH44802.1 hypothetical protein [Planctomycetaceae bacterium]|tara:strand:- start:2487 stop:3632 length:1146 start_codon:yes stop_codon:yes gene_type:complete
MRRHPFLNPNSILLTLLAVTPLAAENPPATLVKAKVTQTAGQDNQSDSRQILTQWAAASSFLSPIGPQSTVEKFKKQNQAYFSGHELTLISQFQQPVSAQTLLSEYQWRILRKTESQISLKGTPSDPLTRHLCRSFELQINTRSMLPEALTFLPGKTKSLSGFAAVELTALNEVHKSAVIAAPPEPKFVSQTVAKAIFPQAGSPLRPAAENPIRRISFSQTSSGNKNETELLEIEKLVQRWVTVSRRIGSVKLANGITLYPRSEQQKSLDAQAGQNEVELSARAIYLSAMQNLSSWLMNVDQGTFVIDSFTIELSTDEPGPVAAKFITLKLKPHPDQLQSGWQSVELEFHTSRSLPIKISETRNQQVVQFLLSGMDVSYTE